LGLQHYLLFLVAQLHDYILVWVLDIEDNGFIPNWLGADAHISFRVRVVLVDLNMVGRLFKVLSVYNVDLEFGVAADAHISHKMNLGLFSLLKLEFNFFLLSSVVDYITHDFVLPLQKFIAGLNIL
jgi:hypothetical protein